VVKSERRERAQKLATAAVAVLLVAAGGWLLGKVIEADDNSKSEASGTTTTAPPDPEAEVEQAYRAYLAMEARLVAAPDPNDAEIPERATGPALARLKEALAEDVEKGHVIRVGPATSQTILSIEVTGSKATVRACFIDESGLYDAATGAELVPMRTGTAIDTAELVREGGAWRVSLRRVPAADEHWEGATSCDR
jgi:hypothetical protein